MQRLAKLPAWLRAARFRAALRAAVLVAALGAAFSYTVAARKPFFGAFPNEQDQLWRINTDYALMAARTWAQWGPARLGFQVHIRYAGNPLAPNVDQYHSYPPLYVAVPWAVSRLTGVFPSLALLHLLGLVAHALFGLAFALWARALALRAGAGANAAALLGAVGGSLLLLEPGCVLYFQNVWWPDLLGLPFFAALAWLEGEAPGLRGRRWLAPAYAALVTANVLADWLGFLVVAVILLKRAGDRDHPEERRHWPELVLPALAAGLAFLAFLARNQLLGELFRKGAERLGIGYPGILPPLRNAFLDYGTLSLPVVVLALFLLPVLVFLFRRARTRRARELSGSLLVLAAPPFLHFLLTRQHYFDHEYAYTKFAPVLVAIPFVALPLAAWGWWNTPRARASLGAGVLAAALAWAWPLPERAAQGLDPAWNLPASASEACEALRPLAAFGDLFLSPTLANADYLFGSPAYPQTIQLACYVPIQLVRTPAEALGLRQRKDWPSAIRYEPPRLRLVFRGPPPAAWRSALRPGTRQAVGDLEVYDLAAPPSR
jgi:hypothetical protein